AEREHECHECGERLTPQLVGAAAVEESVDRGRTGRGEQTDRDRADEATDQVDTDDIERVVVAELELEADSDGADRTGECADHQRSEGRHRTTGRRDRDQSGDHAGGGAEGRRVTVPYALDQAPDQEPG